MPRVREPAWLYEAYLTVEKTDSVLSAPFSNCSRWTMIKWPSKNFVSRRSLTDRLTEWTSALYEFFALAYVEAEKRKADPQDIEETKRQ